MIWTQMIDPYDTNTQTYKVKTSPASAVEAGDEGRKWKNLS